nr:unnamed protein product [Callosobruchus analis]
MDIKSESEKFESDTESKKSEVEDLSKVKSEKSKSPPPKAPSTGSDPEADLCSKQAAELKAMFPDLEVIQPLSRLSQVDTFVLRDKQGSGALDFSETTVAQLFNNAVKWPKEYAIQVRLQHIIYAVETKEWPAAKSFSAYATGIGGEFDVPIHELPNEPPPPKRERDTSTPMSSVGEPDVSISVPAGAGAAAKKRKRHIAIDVETERAKLHALLNSSHAAATPPISKHGMQTWGDNDDSEDSRRSTPVQSTLQPPPAHQQTSRSLSITSMKMPYDLQYHSTPAAKTIGQTTVIPGTSSTLTPIDLSSSIPKNSDKPSASEIQNEVQDFSVKKPTTPTPSTAKSTNKLDDTLSKLMKRKNCPEPEPLVGKEKKRRKLDEIVLGLSAAKEQSLFPVSEPSKKPPVTPSVTVTPASAPVTTSHSPAQKPFTITVTSVPSTSKGGSSSSGIPNLLPQFSGSAKDSFSTFLAQAEQQNLLLKKQQQQQQQQRKSYEAMIADIGKVSDFSSKVNSYSHEAKVNKWLAEQNAALAEQPLSADYLSPRRRRPRVDPTLLDWKKLTGDENVAVIHRVTGKKLTGPKAPTLKRLGQWLMENPMYDIDPKWAELVKERGNLSHDLQKRLSAQQGGAGPGGSGATSAGGGKNKQGGVPGRPSILSSPTGSASSVSSGNLATSLPSSMSFPSLSTSSLAGLNSNLLTGLSAGLGQFDPKTNPLLMPFAGLPNMGALGSMGGLGNLTNMNLFANLAGLGLPGLGGMDPAALASAAAAAESAAAAAAAAGKGSSKGGGQGGGQGKQPKPQEAHASSKSGGGSGQGQSAAAAMAAGAAANPAFPFFFPNPSLLYTPLGLGGLNPFTLQPGMSAAYDSLAQQCGLLNGGLNPAASPNSSSTSSKMSKPSSSSRPPSASATTPTPTTSSSPQMKPPSRSSSRDAHLQQLLLPPDTQILESISKAASSLDITLKQAKSGGGEKKDDKRKHQQQQQAAAAAAAAAAAFDSFRGMLPSDFTVQKKTGLPGLADFTKLLEAQVQVSQVTKKTHEQQMKEALEQLTKSNQELVAKALAEEQQQKTSGAMKRPREASIEMLQVEKSLMPAPAAVPSDEEPLQPPPKKAKEEESRTPSPRVQAPPSGPTLPQSQVQLQPQQQPQPPAAPLQQQQHHDHEGVDIEALLPPSTVVKSTGLTPEKKAATAKEEKAPPPPQPSPTPTPPPAKEEETEKNEPPPVKATTVEEQPAVPSPSTEEPPSKPAQEAAGAGPTAASASAEDSDTSPPAKKGAKRTRGKRKSGEIIIDPESIVAKKNLRSSASRSAAAAAARQKLEAENAQRERNEENANANS